MKDADCIKELDKWVSASPKGTRKVVMKYSGKSETGTSKWSCLGYDGEEFQFGGHGITPEIARNNAATSFDTLDSMAS